MSEYTTATAHISTSPPDGERSEASLWGYLGLGGKAAVARLRDLVPHLSPLQMQVMLHLLLEAPGNAGRHRAAHRPAPGAWCPFDLEQWAATLQTTDKQLRRALRQLETAQVLWYHLGPRASSSYRTSELRGTIGFNPNFSAWKPAHSTSIQWGGARPGAGRKKESPREPSSDDSSFASAPPPSSVSSPAWEDRPVPAKRRSRQVTPAAAAPQHCSTLGPPDEERHCELQAGRSRYSSHSSYTARQFKLIRTRRARARRQAGRFIRLKKLDRKKEEKRRVESIPTAILTFNLHVDETPLRQRIWLTARLLRAARSNQRRVPVPAHPEGHQKLRQRRARSHPQLPTRSQRPLQRRTRRHKGSSVQHRGSPWPIPPVPPWSLGHCSAAHRVQRVAMRANNREPTQATAEVDLACHKQDAAPNNQRNEADTTVSTDSVARLTNKSAKRRTRDCLATMKRQRMDPQHPVHAAEPASDADLSPQPCDPNDFVERLHGAQDRAGLMLAVWLRDLGESRVGAGVAGILGILVRAGAPVDAIPELLALAREKVEAQATMTWTTVAHLNARWWVPSWVRNGGAWFTAVVKDLAAHGAELRWDVDALRQGWLAGTVSTAFGDGADHDEPAGEGEDANGINQADTCSADQVQHGADPDAPLAASTAACGDVGMVYGGHIAAERTAAATLMATDPNQSPATSLVESINAVLAGDTRWRHGSHIWHLAQARVRQDLTGAQYATWLRGTELLIAPDGQFVLVARTTFGQEMLERRFYPVLVAAIRTVTGRSCTVRITTGRQLMSEPECGGEEEHCEG